MRIDVLRQPLMVTLLLFAALAGLFVYRFLALPYPEEIPAAGVTPIENFLLWFTARYEVVSIGICILLIFANGLSISKILTQHMVLSSRSYMPMILYLAICCGIWFGGINLPAVLSSFLLLRSTEYFIHSFVRTTSFNQTFRGALIAGCIPLIYPAAAVYFLAIPTAMSVFRRKGRETIVATVGWFMPLLAYAYIMWAVDLGFTEPLAAIWQHILTPVAGLPLGTGSVPEILRLVAVVVTGVLILFGLASFGTMSGTMRTRGRAIFIYFIFLLLISSGVLFIPAAAPSALVLFAIPAAAIIPAFFSRFPGLFSGIAYIIFLLSVVTLNIYPLLFA